MRMDAGELQAAEAAIIDLCGGIQPPLEIFYIQSIIYAAERSFSAFERFDAAVHTRYVRRADFRHRARSPNPPPGALSRFFWPVKKDSLLAAARGEKLREAFALTDASPLKWRRLRNAFEHFDEDLDRYLIVNAAGFFFPGPRVGDHRSAGPLDKVFKLVDPERGVCVLLGEQFEYRPIQREVEAHACSGRSGGREWRTPSAARYTLTRVGTTSVDLPLTLLLIILQSRPDDLGYIGRHRR